MSPNRRLYRSQFVSAVTVSWLTLSTIPRNSSSPKNEPSLKCVTRVPSTPVASPADTMISSWLCLCIASKNSMKIYGNSHLKNNKKIRVLNLGDHRICMSSTVLALLTGIKTEIKNFETVNTSSPNFLNIIKSLGGKFEIKKKL